MKIARNVMELSPEVKQQILRVYPNMTQHDIYVAMEAIRATNNKRKNKNE